MSEAERDRLKVLHEGEKGHLKQREGAGQLGMSERGFRKLWRRFRVQKDAAAVHGLRGKSSNRRVADEVASRAVEAVKKDYRDFGPTLAAEYLMKDPDIQVSRETLRQLLIRDVVHSGRIELTMDNAKDAEISDCADPRFYIHEPSRFRNLNDQCRAAARPAFFDAATRAEDRCHAG